MRITINPNTTHLDSWFDENGVGWGSATEKDPQGKVVRHEVYETGIRIFIDEPEPSFARKLWNRLTSQKTLKQTMEEVLGNDWAMRGKAFRTNMKGGDAM